MTTLTRADWEQRARDLKICLLYTSDAADEREV